MYFFTADEHYYHHNIIKYTKRPFASAEEMNAEIIKRHNSVVSENDTVIHAGDFTLEKRDKAQFIIDQLYGSHVFLQGSHDRWLEKGAPLLWEKTINYQAVVVFHYAMRTWPKSHHGSWQLHGHSHGALPPMLKQLDVGVDSTNFYPLSFDEIKTIILSRCAYKGIN